MRFGREFYGGARQARVFARAIARSHEVRHLRQDGGECLFVTGALLIDGREHNGEREGGGVARRLKA